VRPYFFGPVALLLLLLPSTSPAESVIARLFHDPKFQLYGLVLGVTVDSQMKVQSLRVVSATDSRDDKRVRIEVPKSFLTALKTRANQKLYPSKFKDGKPVEFFIIAWYSPSYPTIPINDAEKRIDQQSW
jgi:hypothetical protein